MGREVRGRGGSRAQSGRVGDGWYRRVIAINSGFHSTRTLATLSLSPSYRNYNRTQDDARPTSRSSRARAALESAPPFSTSRRGSVALLARTRDDAASSGFKSNDGRLGPLLQHFSHFLSTLLP